MIIDILFLIISLILSLFHGLLSVIDFIIPDKWTEAVEYMFSNLGILQGFFPVAELLQVFGWFYSFLIVWYGFKGVIWIYGMIPYVGKSVGMPNGVPAENNVNLRGNDEGRTVNLKTTKGKNIRKNTKW